MVDYNVGRGQRVEETKGLLRKLYELHGGDRGVGWKYFDVCAGEVEVREGVDVGEEDEEDVYQRLVEEAMPERKKERLTKNVTENTKGGAEVFIPKKRKAKKIRYPKNFNPGNPGQEPDPERWLPKWQRSRFKKYYKKKGLYTKGAQGDAQINTDVSLGITSSTAHKDVAQEKQKPKKRAKR